MLRKRDPLSLETGETKLLHARLAPGIGESLKPREAENDAVVTLGKRAVEVENLASRRMPCLPDAG